MSEDCVNPDYMSCILCLNASALSNSTSLKIKLTLKITSELPFLALIDSGPTHCFIKRKFIKKNKIKTYPIGPLPLTLFNRSVNTYLTEAMDLELHFSTGEELPVTFYVTSLDLTCTIVLGHN